MLTMRANIPETHHYSALCDLPFVQSITINACANGAQDAYDISVNLVAKMRSDDLLRGDSIFTLQGLDTDLRAVAERVHSICCAPYPPMAEEIHTLKRELRKARAEMAKLRHRIAILESHNGQEDGQERGKEKGSVVSKKRRQDEA
ncbi:hypothetical protein J1614_011708 [Plenodomus biglobosus]|nr:hypothetical protein J1614_011708 [Plenodomus biglobosus]